MTIDRHPSCPVCEHPARLLKTEVWSGRRYRVYRCLECGSVFCPDRHETISPDYVSRTRDDIDAFVMWCQGAAKAHAQRQLFRTLTTLRHRVDVLVDFGCGTGGFLHSARAHGVSGLFGFDASAAQASIARAEFGEVRCSTSLAEYARQHGGLPAPDLITLWDVIEHLRDPAGALADIRASATPDTLIFFCTPNGSSEFVKLHLRRMAGVRHSFIPWEHVLYFSKAGIRRFLGQHGYDVIVCTAAVCYRRPLSVGEVFRRLGYAASAWTPLAPQLFVLCRLKT